MSVVDEIKSRLDIVQYIQQTVPLKRAGSRWKACCPFHSEKSASFFVDPGKQTWRCFGSCSQGGDIFSFAQKRHGWTFNEALQELAKLAGIELKAATPEQKTQNEQLDRLRGLMSAAADYYHERLLDTNDHAAVAALNYARRKRGLTDDTLTRFAIGFAPAGWRHALDYFTALGYGENDLLAAGLASKNEDSGRVFDRFRNRLMIPIRDGRGRVVGFGARALPDLRSGAADDEPKYLNSPQTALFDKSHVLFGLDLAAQAIRDTETAVIVEGYMDAISAHQAGFTNVVAQMGTAMTEAQLKLIAPRWAKRIVLSLDSDAAGQSATLRGLEVARQTLQADYTGRLSVDIRILTIPDAKDPDDLFRESPERWEELVRLATPVAEYVIAAETAALPPDASPQQKEATARKLLPILTVSENSIVSRNNVHKLSMALRIEEGVLEVWGQENKLLKTKEELRLSAKERALLKNSGPSAKGKPNSNLADTNGNLALQPGEPPDFLPTNEPVIPSEVIKSAPQTDIHLTGREALEACCLAALFIDPNLYYEANRKLRELAGNEEALAQGPLKDLSADDFSRSDYRTLMMVFEAAMEQLDLAPQEFVRTHFDPSLAETLDEVVAAIGLRTLDPILLGRTKDWTPRPGFYGRGDLAGAMKQGRYAIDAANLTTEFVQQVLDLRIQRLKRERQEMLFMQIDLQEDGGGTEISHQVQLSGRAEHLIHAETRRQRNFLRHL